MKTLTTTLLAGCLMAACSSDGMKNPFDGIMGSDDSKSKPKTITKVDKNATKVLDTGCPNIVEPYTLDANAMAIARLSADIGVENAKAAVAAGLGQHRVTGQTDLAGTVRLAAKQLNWLPMDVEKQYGQSEHDKLGARLLARTKKSEKKYAIADKLLADVRASVPEEHDYDLQIFILKEPGTNALSFAGGYLYIQSDLLDPKYKSKAYFAVAHETAHILRRHETKDLQSMAIDSVTDGSDLIKLISSPRGNFASAIGAATTSKNRFAKHFADQELDADSCATRMMVSIFPSPPGTVLAALRAFEDALGPVEAASADAKGGARGSEFDRYAASVHELVESPFRQHPNSAERRANIDKIYASLSSGALAAQPAQKEGLPEGALKKRN